MSWKALVASLGGAFVLLPAAEVNVDRKIEHALSRMTFGARPGDAAAVKKAGLKQWIDRQLHPERIPESPALTERLAALKSLSMESGELSSAFPRKLKKPPSESEMAEARMRIGRAFRTASSTEERREVLTRMAPGRVPEFDLVEAKILRAVYSERQLAEVLADFWFGHFNVDISKGADRLLVTAYERDAIRPHVLGRFSDLLKATAQSPAMLFYLDNWQSVSPDAQLGRARKNGRFRGLNENYARELMELHTLGVAGGYTQKDVTEVARCFTGWTIGQPLRDPRFEFNSRMHDRGEKTVLGAKIPAGGGIDDGLKVLDILAKHPSTATHLSRRLAQRFVSDNPPEALVARMAKTYAKSDGDLRSVLKTMFDSPEFWNAETMGAKLRSPLEFAAAAARATNAEITTAFALANQIGKLGQPLYRKQEPTGYSNHSEEWLNTASLLGRLNFATELASNRLPGVRIDTAKLGETADELSKRLASPEFQKR